MAARLMANQHTGMRMQVAPRMLPVMHRYAAQPRPLLCTSYGICMQWVVNLGSTSGHAFIVAFPLTDAHSSF